MKRLVVIGLLLLIPFTLREQAEDLGPCVLGPACDKEAALVIYELG